MAFAQRLLQRRMQLRRIDVAIVQVAFDEGCIHLHHLLHQRPVGLLDGGEIGGRAGAGLVVEAVHHPGTAAGGQVDRQALAAEGGLDLNQQALQVHPLRVDLVDDDQAVAATLGRPLHHFVGHRLDARGGADHDCGGLHRFERRQRLSEALRRPWSVDQVGLHPAMPEMGQRGVQ